MTSIKRDILASFNKSDLLEVAQHCELEVDDNATPDDLRVLIAPIITLPKRVLFASLSKAEPRAAEFGLQLNELGKVTKEDIIERMAPAECVKLAKVLPTLASESLRLACKDLGLSTNGLTSAAFAEQLLTAVMFSDEEQEHLVNAFMALTNDNINERLRDKGVKTREKKQSWF